MDEKFMVMEQERLSKERKRKKNRKKFGVGAAVCLAAVIGGIWYLGWGSYPGDGEENTVKITADAGQEIIYASLSDVKGNEITYVVAQEAQTAEEEISQEKPDGEMPQMEGGELLRDGERFGMGDMSGFMNQNSRNREMTDSTDSFTYNNVTYELTDEAVTTIIPVGTDVTTKLGTVTTFSRLAAGDKVALVAEEQDGKQIIVAVYIID